MCPTSVCVLLMVFRLNFFCKAVGTERCLVSDNLSDALEKLKLASKDTDSVESCLDCLLKALFNNSEYSFITR